MKNHSLPEYVNDLKERQYRDTYKRGIVNGVFFRSALALIGPATVSPLFLASLTDKNWLIGLGSTISIGGWFLPQIFAAHFISRMRLRLPWYKLMGAIRAISLGCIALAAFILGANNSTLLLGIFLFFISLAAVSGGLGGIVLLDLVGKSIPTKGSAGRPGRGSFFGWRLALSGITGILIGFLVINPVLDRLAYPDNFATIFGLAAVCVGLGVMIFGSVNELPVTGQINSSSLGTHLKKCFALPLVDKSFRRYFVMRHSLMLYMMGFPFYILFAKQQYELTPFWVGFYMASRFAGEMTFNLVWAKLSDRGHNRAVLRGTAVLALAPPLICFAQYSFGFPELFFALSFFFSGGTLTGAIIGGNNYLLQHAPSESRHMYIGVVSTTIGITIHMSTIGGVVLDQFGFMTLFTLVTALAILAIISSLSVKPSTTT